MPCGLFFVFYVVKRLVILSKSKEERVQMMHVWTTDARTWVLVTGLMVFEVDIIIYDVLSDVAAWREWRLFHNGSLILVINKQSHLNGVSFSKGKGKKTNSNQIWFYWNVNDCLKTKIFEVRFLENEYQWYISNIFFIALGSCFFKIFFCFHRYQSCVFIMVYIAGAR